MGGMVQGAALGAVFELLILLFLNATKKVVRFGSDLNRFTSTLSLIKRLIDDKHNSHKICESEKESFNHLLIEAEKLIQKCSQIKWINIFSRWYYSKKLNKLEVILLNFFVINVAAFHLRESNRISVIVSNVEEKIDEIAIMIMNNNSNIYKPMGGVVQGAALGAVFELLILLFLNATKKVVCFGPDLNRFTSTVSLIKRLIDDIQHSHKICESEKESFNHRLIEAENLIQKCSNIKWNIFSRWYYSRKLNKLEALLFNFFQAASHSRESERIFINVAEKIDEIAIMIKNNIGIGGDINSNRVPESNVDGVHEEGGYCGEDPQE
ncbi:hypothetical protein BUALT_Bualt04G0117500 [Buddleja alternifolia]|uniref:RPW8 domain-containing protein n=1 Tax=Buddleja alternifolia TaxID=168488 RepID=A0AAV6XN79_9LAMI|nr:hypothetical protein BUALT_Bualt04G0117500 [Buddleja alternifolia]